MNFEVMGSREQAQEHVCEIIARLYEIEEAWRYRDELGFRRALAVAKAECLHTNGVLERRPRKFAQAQAKAA